MTSKNIGSLWMLVAASSLSYTTAVIASLQGTVFWNEQLALSSRPGIALIILSGVASVHRMPERRSPLPALEKSPQAPTL